MTSSALRCDSPSWLALCSLRRLSLLLAHRPVLSHHRSLGEIERCAHIWHEFHGFVHRVEFNRVVQEEEIRLVMGVPFHLADQCLLIIP